MKVNQKILQTYLNPAVTRPASAPRTKNLPVPKGAAFQDLLNQEIQNADSIRFSNHVALRMKQRNISFDNQEMAKINEAFTRAEDKGAKESLFLTQKAALVVSVPNRTVITAVDPDSMKQNVFTNIDSAMFV